ncbi:hypothetical protein Golomagni_05971 [Golovinomyces magnicellulatus]|nr:hypothetical protein Golomagni_05971 [Golovinomyces magnicellulatus]
MSKLREKFELVLNVNENMKTKIALLEQQTKIRENTVTFDKKTQFISSTKNIDFIEDEPYITAKKRPNTADKFQPLQSAGSSHLPQITKIPDLAAKLSDGIEISASLWKSQILDKFETYESQFISHRQKKNYLIDQTEGIARKFLEPLVLNSHSGQEIDDLIEEVVNFLTNPAEVDNARNDYLNLEMTTNQTFWEFYREFRVSASTAGITQDLVLRNDLRDKILTRLRIAVANEWPRCNNLRDYAAAIQNIDSDIHAARSRNARRNAVSPDPK